MFREWGLVLAMGLCFGAGLLIGLSLGSDDDITRKETLRDALEEPVLQRAPRDDDTESASLPSIEADSKTVAAGSPQPKNGTLAGRVISHEGEPVADLPLRLSAKDGESIALATDSAGVFSAEVERGATYTLIAESEDWTLEPSFNEGLDSLRAGDDIDALASRLFPVHVDVILPDGGRPDEAKVIYRRIGIVKQEVPWTPDQRTLWLPKGVYELFARTDSKSWSHPASAIVEDEIAKSVTIRMGENRGGPRVKGRVIAVQGELWKNVSIACRRDGKLRSEQELDRQSTDFEFLLDEPGQYDVIVMRDRRVAHVQPIEVDDSLLRLEVHLPPVGPDCSATLVVLDPWGRPALGVRARLLVYLEKGQQNGHVTPLPAPQNRIRIFYGQDDLDVLMGRVEGRVDLVLESEFGRKLVSAPPPGALQEFRFERASSTRIDCRSVLSMLDAGDAMQLKLYEEGITRGGIPVESNGFATLPVRQPGPLELRLTISDADRRVYSFPRQEVQLSSGEQVIPVSLPALHPLVLEGQPMSHRRTFELLLEGSDSIRRTAEAKGGDRRVIFKYLPPGRYRLTSREGRELDRAVLIPTESEIWIDW